MLDPSLEKVTLNLRAGDMNFIQEMNKKNRGGASEIIRKLVSRYVDERRDVKQTARPVPPDKIRDLIRDLQIMIGEAL